MARQSGALDIFVSCQTSAAPVRAARRAPSTSGKMPDATCNPSAERGCVVLDQPQQRCHHPACGMMYDTFHSNIEEKSVTDAVNAGGDKLFHIHISENDRSTPGEGAVRWDENFDAIINSGYDGWLVIEAFGLALPEIAAATKIWRRMYKDEITLATEGLNFMKSEIEKRQV